MFGDYDSSGLGYRWVMKMAGEQNLSRPYAQHPWVHACVSAIGKAVSSVPLVIQRRTADGQMEPVEDGPLHDLLAKPNKLMSQRKFLTSLTQTQKLYGETMILMMEKKPNGVISYIDPSETFEVPAELWPVRGDLLEEIIDERTQLPRAWRMNTGSGTLEVPDESLVHVAESNPYNPIRGMGPMQAAYRTAAKDFVLDRYDEALLQNSGSPGGILSVEGHLTDADQRAISDAWREAHGRPDSHRKTAVLPQGTKYDEIGFSPQEMEFMEMRSWNRETIMAIFGVTKPIIGLTEGLNYASSMSAFRTFWEVTVVPFLEFLSDELETKFIRRLRGPESEYHIGFDLSGVAALREDADSKVERTIKLFSQGGRTFNEAADLAGWDVGDTELVNADEAYINASLIPSGSAATEETLEPGLEPGEGLEPDPEADPEADPQAEPANTMEATADPSVSLNGAQIQSLLNLIEQYASGRLPKDTVVQLIIAAFPFDQARAERILEAVEVGSIPDEEAVKTLVDKVDQEELDEVYSAWRESVNMSASELRAWRENPCSRKASVNPTAVIDRNLRLLETKKDDWDGTHVRAAKRTISFIARMRQNEQGEPVGDCPSKRDISLKNWAFDPAKGARAAEKSPACRVSGESESECITRKVPEILDENPGMEQDQAVAIAASLCSEACGAASSSAERKGGLETLERAMDQWNTSIQKTEASIARSSKRVLRDVVLHMRKRLREVAVVPPEERGFQGSVVKAIATEAEIARLLDLNLEAWSAEMVAAIGPKVLDQVIQSAIGTHEEIGGSGLILSRTDPMVVQYMAEKELVLANITTNTIDEVQRAIVRILAKDDTPYASLREAIYATLEQSDEYMNATLKGLGTRAQLIARTETTGAANFGRYNQFLEDGIYSGIWHSPNPANARPHHQELNGRERNLGEEFGYGLKFPGDPNADVSELANCNCILLPGKNRES